ncbi:MAG TPA: substrate-binding domain-containing protein [Anaerolineae bacterium]
MKRTILFLVTVSLVMLFAAACAAPAPQAAPATPVVVEKIVVQTPTPQPVGAPPTPVVVEKMVVATPTPNTFDCTKQNIAYLSFGSQAPYIAMVDDSMKRAAKAKGINLLVLDNELKPDKAVDNANTIVTRGNVNLVYEFNYYQEQNFAIADIFKKAKIPVIAIDIPVSGSSYYGANNYEAGKLAGKGLAEWANKNWPNQVDLALAEAQSMAGSGLLQQRTQGIMAGFKEGLPYLKADQITQFEGSTDVNKLQEAISTLLTANPTKKHILIGLLGDSNAVAAVNAAQAAGRADQVEVAGQGGDDVGLGALRGPKNGFLGTTAYLPDHYGDDLIPLGCDLLAGKQIPAESYIKHVFLTRDNVDQYYPKK